MEQQLQISEPKEVTKPRLKLPKIGKRQVIVSFAILLIAAAVVLNFVLFGNGAPVEDAAPVASDGEDAGDAAPVTEDGYFSATQVSRQRARDEALEVLQGVVESEEAEAGTKNEALLEISTLAREMELEANIETLVLAKGFTQCVAVINGDTCTVVVDGNELTQSQIAQINEIVYEQAAIKPVDVRIITK